MPITVNGPDGTPHYFQDGTDPAHIQAEMEEYYGPGGQLQHAGPTPPRGLPGPGSPTAASGAEEPTMTSPVPNYNNDEDMSNVAAAMMFGRPVAMALQNTPGQVMRREMAKKAADNLGTIEAAQASGRRVLKGLNMIRGTVGSTDDDTLNNAIGTTANPWFQWGRRLATGAITAPLQAAGMKSTSVPYDASYNTNNLLQHDVHGLVTEFATAGKALNMSDERQREFAETMGAMLHATSREKLLQVAQHAEAIVRDAFYLQHPNLPEEHGPGASGWPSGGPPGSTPGNASVPDVNAALQAKTAQESGVPPGGRPRYKNPQTGETIEWDGTKYVKVP